MNTRSGVTSSTVESRSIPSVDNIVRVQVRRLRSKLEKYYAFEGQVDPLVVEVPRGGYDSRSSGCSCRRSWCKEISTMIRQAWLT